MTSTRTFQNPVLPGMHPDPSVCRVGDDYYLVCSTMEYFPGLPVFHSRDLVRWRQLGNVVDRPGQLAFAPDLAASRGIYAPTIRHHDGRFYVVTTSVTGHDRDEGHLIFTTADPAGPWSDPVRLDLPGLDPDLAWDDDGACWCTFSGVRTARIDPDAGTVLDGPWPVWSGSGLQYPESPHLYRVGDDWYLLVSEGGTHTGHAVSIARAPGPRGPFTPAPGNPLLTHAGTSRPVQAAGHADLVEAADGTWWMVLLGIRQKGAWPRYHVLGRETFLTRVEWRDGWPVVAPVDPVMPAPDLDAAPAGGRFVGDPVRDDFTADTLDPAWISPRSRPAAAWSLAERPGWLTLHARGASLDRPGATFLGRRQQHHDCRAATRVDAGDATCGLSVRLDEAHHYDLQLEDGRARVISRIGPARAVLADRPVPAGPLTLAVEARTTDLLPPTMTSLAEARTTATGVEAEPPDVLSFRIDTPQGPVVLAELDGRYLSTETAGGFTGRVIGVYVLEGSAAFDWFEYGPAPAAD